MFDDYYVPRTWSVCILDKDDNLEYLVTFSSIYPFGDAGWYDDLDDEILLNYTCSLDYEILSFCIEL